jgi:hypothetical protein
MTSRLKLRTAQVEAADGAGWAAEGMELGNGFY